MNKKCILMDAGQFTNCKFIHNLIDKNSYVKENTCTYKEV